MSKQYEHKAINAELVLVQFDTQLKKRTGGSYPGTKLVYNAFDKINEKGIHEKTFEFKPELRGQLEALQPNDKFTLNMYREEGTQFWNIDSVTKGHTQQRSSSSGTGQARTQQGSTSSSSYSSVNPAEVGQCLNLAVQLGVAKTYDELSNPSVMATAIALYKGVKKQYTDNWDKAQEEVKQAVATENHGPAGFDDDDTPF